MRKVVFATDRHIARTESTSTKAKLRWFLIGNGCGRVDGAEEAHSRSMSPLRKGRFAPDILVIIMSLSRL
jgi:hypothetical protein